ncbi:hypothetical protein LXL04_024213 [Taraxacum kok-saghyz]
MWFSIDDNGKYQEMISAMKFMHLGPNKYEVIALRESSPTCRFPMVAKIFDASKLNMQVKITTQFLSSGVTYAAYLRCKHKYSADYPVIRSLKYRLNNHNRSYKSYCGDYKDGWRMLELFQTTSNKRSIEFNVLLQGFCLANFLGDDEVIVEGIVFLPIQKFDEEITKDHDVENLPTTEIECRLPNDYKQYVYSGKNMVKRVQSYFIVETKEEAFSVLTRGVHMKTKCDLDVPAWFSYNNLSGLVPGTGQFSYFNYTSFLGNPDFCGPYLGPYKDGVINSTHQKHLKGLSSSVKLLLVTGLLFCSIAFAVAAILKARSIKKGNESRAWKLTTFQRLDFTCDDVLDNLKEENIIEKGGAGIVYNCVMPNNEHVEVCP